MTLHFRLLTSAKFIVACLMLIHLILLINTKFTLWPEMVVYPYLANNDFILYRDLINPYPPIFIIFLSLFSKIFNYSILSYQVLTWTIILALDISIYFLSKNIFMRGSLSLIAVVFFIILSIPFGANQLWFDLVQALPIMYSVYFFHRFISGGRAKDLDISVALALSAVVIKQQAIWLLLAFAAIFIIAFKNKIIKLILEMKYSYAFLLITLFFHLTFLTYSKNIKDFYYWVVYFPLFKASSAHGYFLSPSIKQSLIIFCLICMLIPVAMKAKKQTKMLLMVSLSLLLFSYPRFDYFHLIPFLAVVSLFAPEILRMLFLTRLPVKIIVTFALIVLLGMSFRYFAKNWTTDIRFFDSDVINAANLLVKVTNSQDRIYIQNGPDQLLPLASRLPPKPWADEFPWYLEGNNLQKKITESLELESVKHVVYKPYSTGEKYDLGSYSPLEISSYINKNFENDTQISDTLWLKTRKSFN